MYRNIGDQQQFCDAAKLPRTIKRRSEQPIRKVNMLRSNFHRLMDRMHRVATLQDHHIERQSNQLSSRQRIACDGHEQYNLVAHRTINSQVSITYRSQCMRRSDRDSGTTCACAHTFQNVCKEGLFYVANAQRTWSQVDLKDGDVRDHGFSPKQGPQADQQQSAPAPLNQPTATWQMI